MNNTMFFEELIFLDRSVKNSDEFFEFVFPILKDKGYVHDSFLSAIKEREASYPTALPTQPWPIALPHTDIEHIIKPFVSVTRLTHSAFWHEMANNDNILPVNFIFLLGFIDTDGHINLLQKLMSCLSNEQFITALTQTQTTKQTIELLKSTIEF